MLKRIKTLSIIFCFKSFHQIKNTYDLTTEVVIAKKTKINMLVKGPYHKLKAFALPPF